MLSHQSETKLISLDTIAQTEDDCKKSLFTQCIPLIDKDQEEINKQILNSINQYQAHAIKYIGCSGKKYENMYNQLENLRNDTIPEAFHHCSDHQFIEIKEILVSFLELLNDELRMPDNKESLITRFNAKLTDITWVNIHEKLVDFITEIYEEDLEKAVINENTDTMKNIIRSKWLNVRSVLLFKACENGKLESAKALLNMLNVNINYQKDYGDYHKGATPFGIAAESGHIEIIKLLKNFPGLDPNLSRKWDNSTPLLCAVRTNNVELVKELIDIPGIDIDLVNKYKKNPLIEAINQKNIQIVEVLLDAGANLQLLKIPPTGIHDIDSLLQASLQEVLIKLMLQLGYLSNKNGICNPFSMAILLTAMSNDNSLFNLFDLLFSLRKLKLNEYKISVMQQKIIPGTIFVRKSDHFLEYKFISPQGKPINDRYEIGMDLKDKPLTTEFLEKKLPDILKHALSKGYTDLSDVKTFKNNHDNLIKQAQNDALKAMEIKNKNDLNEKEKIEFIKITREKLKGLRAKLSDAETYKENLFIQMTALFDAMDIYQHYTEYLDFHPINNSIDKPRVGIEPTEDHIIDLIKPSCLHVNPKELFINRFMGAYKKDELAHHYLGELRQLLKESKVITGPIILRLGSTNHIFTILYRKITDKWYFYDINSFPRSKKELKNYEFEKNEDLASRIVNNLLLGVDSAYTLIDTRIFTAAENIFPQVGAWDYFLSVKEKENATKIRKAELTRIIDKWYEKLLPFHQVTPEKILIKVHDEGTLLFLASRAGYVDNVKELIQMKADPNAYSTFGFTSFHIALITGHVNVFNELLKSKIKIIVNRKSKEEKNTLLSLAAFSDKSEIAEIILKNKMLVSQINPNLIDIYHQTPLFIAACKGTVSIVKLLLNTVFKYPLDLDCSKNGYTPLHAASEHNHDEIVELLLNSNKVDVNKQTKDGCTALYTAIFHNNTTIAKKLIQTGKINFNIRTIDKGQTPLMIAIYEKEWDIVKDILQTKRSRYDFDINMPDLIGHTAVHYAALEKDVIGLKMILESKYYADKINLEAFSIHFYTPIMTAVVCNNIEAVKLLLNTHKVNPNRTFIDSGMSLLDYAIQNDFNEIIDILLNIPNIDLNIFDKNEVTPLTRAISYKDKDLVKKILMTGKADVNLLTPTNHFPPLQWATDSMQHEMVRILLSYNANPNVCNTFGYTPLYYSCKQNDMDSINEYLKMDKIDMDLCGDGASSPLFHAAMKGYTPIVKALLQNKANPNLPRVYDGATPIYMAAQFDFYHVVQMLLEYNADPNITLTMKGNIVKEYPDGEYPPSPLEIAVKKGNINVVTQLLTHKAEPFKKEQYPDCASEALKKCCGYQAKTSEELAEHYKDFIEMDTIIQKLTNKVKTIFTDEKIIQRYTDKLMQSYENYVDGTHANEIVNQLIEIRKDIESSECEKTIEDFREKYRIKDHVKLGQLLFSPSRVDRSKEFITMALDNFMEEYNDNHSSIHTSFKKCLHRHFDKDSLESLRHSIYSEIRFLSFSRMQNKNYFIKSLENIGLQITKLSFDLGYSSHSPFNSKNIEKQRQL